MRLAGSQQHDRKRGSRVREERCGFAAGGIEHGKEAVDPELHRRVFSDGSWSEPPLPAESIRIRRLNDARR